MLTESQTQQYERDGYFIVTGLFDGGEVRQLREAMIGLLQSFSLSDRCPDVGFDPWRRTDGDDANPNRIVYLNDLHLRHARLNQHMRSEKLAEIFTGLWQADVNAFQAASVIKPNDYNADYLGWHQDTPDYVPLSNDRNGCVITYLDHMGPDTGGTSLVPGTHRSGLPKRIYLPVDGWPEYLKKRTMEGFDEDKATIVAPHFNPGDALVFHSSIYHKANANYSATTKIGLINVYQAVDCVDLTRRNQFKAADLPITRRGQIVAG
ncbi:MAG: phytanoyl-CoA dioxygenase family protein [Proteobacteria bacterium]|jgi:ectoine hydroxylase-related dioxygenase (phytanoyl-CoA dioxygenase family)|nr:phytanoyl-CoA dioxygenase family protein [Pseudomonadota bacterium]MDA1302028.1 phytanoyl-CoA dioxygenase family protein [Pseudomonadota bacterium]